jgi:hypothetical protein
MRTPSVMQQGRGAAATRRSAEKEEEDHKIRETFRYKQLVEQEVAARHAKIRAQAMREHQDEFRSC